MELKTMLITGFDPFGGEAINPSWEAVKSLPGQIGAYRIERMELPTVYGVAAEAVIRRATELNADVVLCIGQAGGRSAITPEVVGINLREASIPDNAGNSPQAEPIQADAPAAYFSTLPVRCIRNALREHGIPSTLSYSAGAFVCNDVLYSLLHRFDQSPTKVGFIHVPFLPEQAKNGQPSLPFEQILKGLRLAVEALSQALYSN